ncbi:MAG TPA: YbaN family protein [Povalibacter sp.]|uniref:YbaN family protein n=1 Tax=Povalibacter sp. TaxID=1962978 RepID=UPI002C97636A|nr:YbaN family protein [Povalibacter sp.]HMN44594.1 YbaN family protein [Povalibacter sp.]
MLRSTQILLWRLTALLALGLGIIGVAIPVLPTVPFLILAAWAGGKGWPVLEQRLLAHSTYGPHIRVWRERGVIPRKAKMASTSMMAVSAIGLQFAPAPLWLRVGAPLLMLVVALWLWRQPEI